MKISRKPFSRIAPLLSKFNSRAIFPKAWQCLRQALGKQPVPMIGKSCSLPEPSYCAGNLGRRQPLKNHSRLLVAVPWRTTKSTKAEGLFRQKQPHISAAGGQFLSRAYTNTSDSRDYKIYIPSSYCGQALPLVVMLHGCRQSPDDFAAGTRMNLIAEQNQCVVVYPAQSNLANKMNCWNWFKPTNQQRDGEEPSLIAGITRQAIATYGLDPCRVYIAGLSSGGAMAGIMGATYPDLYAAVGIHSGMPYAGIRGLLSALTAMKTGGSFVSDFFQVFDPTFAAPTIPAIVFHGDRDTTIHPHNGDKLMTQCGLFGRFDQLGSVTEQFQRNPRGHDYTKRVQRNASGGIVAEQWLVHGSGHAWSGGSDHGSYTDSKGPDAAGEMLRFFYLHAQSERVGNF